MNNDDFEVLLVFAIDEHRIDSDDDHDDVWQQLNAGKITAEEVVELRRGLDSNEELAHKLRLFAPMSEPVRRETRQMLLDRYYGYCLDSSPDEPTSGTPNLTAVPTPILTLIPTLAPTLDPPFTTKLDPTPSTKLDSPPSTKLDPPFTTKLDPPPNTKLDPPTRDSATTVRASPKSERRGTRWLHWTSATLVLAAAILLAWFFHRPDAMTRSEVMPGFTVEFRNGDSGRMRGSVEPMEDPRCLARYRVDQELSVLIRPIRPQSGELAVAILTQRRGQPARWSRPAPPQQGTRGHIRIEQSPAELGLSPGVWTLTFYVTDKGRRHDLQVLRELPPGNHPSVAIIETTVCIVD